MMVNCLKLEKMPVTTPGQGVDSGFFGGGKEMPPPKKTEPVPEAVPFRQKISGFIKSTSYGGRGVGATQDRYVNGTVGWLWFLQKITFAEP